jgi:hypothetical protein
LAKKQLRRAERHHLEEMQAIEQATEQAAPQTKLLERASAKSILGWHYGDTEMRWMS